MQLVVKELRLTFLWRLVQKSTFEKVDNCKLRFDIAKQLFNTFQERIS